MVIKIAVGVFIAILAFCGYVSTRDGHFKYERSGVINAYPEKIFPFISNYQKAQLWNPFDPPDEKVKHKVIGTDGTVGAVLEYDGPRNTGKLEMLKIEPSQNVEMKLTMVKPMSTENIVRYHLTPDGDKTRFTWSMEGNSGFLGKLISTVFDCEKMIGGTFEKGIAKLKTVVEAS